MKIATIKDFKIGSTAFFSDIPTFVSKDIDMLAIVDNKLPTDTLNMKLGNKDIFFMQFMSKEDLIEKTLKSNDPIKVGKFIVPEFCKYIGFTIDDYACLDSLFDKLDEKHRYEIIIKEAYKENNSFELTDRQKDLAYEEYMKARR